MGVYEGQNVPEAALHRLAGQLYPYVDDWLVRDALKATLLWQLQLTWTLLIQLGLIPSVEKSCLVPSQDMVFVGMRLRTREGIVCPTSERLAKLSGLIQTVVSAQAITAPLFLTLIGVMVSLIDIVPWARLRLRPVQLYLLALWRPSRDTLSSLVPIRPALRYHLIWWTNRENLEWGDVFSYAPSRQIPVH